MILEDKKSHLFFILSLVMMLVSAFVADACTSAIISADRTVAGRPLLWKHRDTSNANSRIAYIPAEEAGELNYVGLFNANDPHNRQAWMGMNEAGFAIMNTASYNILPKGVKAKNREGVVMAAALKKCRTVDDFAHFLDSLPRPLGVEANFGVIDALGNGAYFETGNVGYRRYDLKDAPDGILVRTNYSHSGREGEGSGYMREKNALAQLLPAAKTRSITPEFITESVSRSFFRDDIGYDCLNDSVRIIHDKDFIPRYTSVATCVVEGMRPAGTMPDAATVGEQYIMWTGLGYPPAAEIRPVWCRPDGVAAELQGTGASNHAPLADKAQKARLDVFGTRPKEGKKRFVDLDKLSNSAGNGYMQQAVKVNKETYIRYSNR